MLATPFTPVTNCPLNTTVTTSTITITAADNGKSLSSVQGGSAIVNGVAVTSFPVTLYAGSTLAITTTSSSSNDTATFVTVTFGGQQYIVTFVTKSPYSNIFDTDMYAVPFYQRTYSDGSMYDSTVHTYSVANNGVVTEKQTTATPSGVTNTTYQVMVLDPYNDEAHLVGSDGVLVNTFNVPDAAWTGATIYNVGKFTFWFGLIHEKQVGITLDGVNFTYLTFDASPVAIASNLNASYIWVACYDGSIFCFHNIGPLTFQQVAQVKLKTPPTSMVVDSAFNLYVVSMNDSIVSKFSVAGTLLGTATVGNMPIGIAFANSQLFVSCAEDKDVVVLNSSTLASTGSITVPEFPGLITTDPTNSNLCVTCLSSNNVYRYKTDSSLAAVDVTAFGKPVLAAYSFGTTIIADHLQYDARPYTRSYKSVVPGLGFFENDQEPIGMQVSSTTVTVTEIEVPVPITIPSTLGASIVLNGANIGTSGTVHNNDQFYITFTTPSTGKTFTQIPVSVGNYVEPWNTTTSAILSAPSPFYFTPLNTAPSTQVQSSVVTISGLTTGTSVTVSTSVGTLLKNGTAQSGSFSVVNGDTIQLQLTSSATAGGSVNAVVTAGTFSTIWNVYTSLPIQTHIQSQTNVPLSTTVTSTPYTFASTAIDPVTHQTVPVSTTISFPSGVTVKVNGTPVSSGATIHTNDQIVISGVTAAQYSQQTTFAVSTAEGNVFELQATTIPNVVPYPMDFGVIYDAAPGIMYQSLDVTAQTLNASTQLQLHYAGTFLISDGDTLTNTITIQNGSIVGLNVRGQASPHNQMYTVPVYALSNDGVTLVQCGSVRIVPMILKGSIDYPYEWRGEGGQVQFVRYVEGMYLEVAAPNMMANMCCCATEVDVATGWTYTSVNGIDSGYQYTARPYSTAYAETQYAFVFKDGTAPYWETQYAATMYDNTAPYHETQYAPGWYFYKTGNSPDVQQTYVQIKYPDYHVVNKVMPKAVMPAQGNSWEVRPKVVNYKNGNLWEVKIKTTNNKYGVFARVATKMKIDANHTMVEFGTNVGTILPGYWLSDAPMPILIDHLQLLTQMPTGYMPPGCQHGYPNARTPFADSPILHPFDSATAISTDGGGFEFDGMATQVTVVNSYEFDANQPMSYSDEVNPSIENPTLFGGFADQTSAEAFITSNNLQNAHVYQLSNGYWIVITDVSQDLACAIVPEHGLRAIGWLLQGG
jgi:hypothetical protein